MQRPLISSANPFIGQYEVPIIRTFIVKKKNSSTSNYAYVPDDIDEDYQNPDNNTPGYYDVEQLQRTSLFKNDDVRDRICLNAKPTTMRLFLYIAYYLLKLDEDFVRLKPDLVQNALGISRNVLYLAIAELKTFRVLANGTKRNIYFINPEYLYNGRRIKYLEERMPSKLTIVHTKVKYI